MIADPRGIIREGLRYLLESEHGIEVVALAVDAAELFQKVQTAGPNVAVIDERLLKDLRSGGSLPPVIALCDSPPAIPLPGVTFLDKTQLFEGLISAVREHARAVPAVLRALSSQPLTSGQRSGLSSGSEGRRSNL